MRILLGIDGSRYALAATRFICDYLAQPSRHVDIVHVLPLRVQAGAAPPRHQPEHLRVPADSRSWLERAEKRLKSRGFTTARHVRRGVPARVVTELVAKGDYDLVVLGARALRGRAAAAIVEEAHRADAQLIVLGSRGARGPAGPILGSVALQVARHAPCSVLVVRGR